RALHESYPSLSNADYADRRRKKCCNPRNLRNLRFICARLVPPLNPEAHTLRPEIGAADCEGWPGWPPGHAERCARRDQVWVQSEVNLIAGPGHVAPGDERIAGEQAQRLGDLIADVDADLGPDGEGVARRAAGVARQNQQTGVGDGLAVHGRLAPRADDFMAVAQRDLGNDIHRPALAPPFDL